MTAELTEERRQYLVYNIQQWLKRDWVSRKEVESFHGHLQFAASIIRHGRFFLGAITALVYVDPGRLMVKIGPAAKADLRWWFHLLVTCSWSGIVKLLRDPWILDFDLSLEITTDASGRGRGVYFNGRWMSKQWSEKQLQQAWRIKGLSMVWLELFAIVDACATFGRYWRGLRITLQTDSESVVSAWNSQRSSNPELRFLFRKICLFMSVFDFDLQLIHLAGKLNIKADLLSRLQVGKFLKMFPEAESLETTACEWWLHT
jgi:hypothetical protein